MNVEIGSWVGNPSTLEDVLTPVKLRVSNEGSHPLSLRYQDFVLSNPTGVRSSALPPFQIRGSAETPYPLMTPGFRYRNYSLYPYYRFYGPSFGFWRDDWRWNSAWYNTNYGYWRQDLPTADMLRQAIPEGVLNSGGEVEG